MKDTSAQNMEWVTLIEGHDGNGPMIYHSTPKSHRPAPTESPNLSTINSV